MKRYFTTLLLNLICLCASFAQKNNFQSHAVQTLDRIYQKFGNTENQLLAEKYPFDNNFKADYLNNNQQAAQQKKYAYLWPFSGSFSAVNALLELPEVKNTYQKVLDEKVLPGLREYRDVKRNPTGYASYLNTAAASDRFYDDNIWLGIDFTDSYIHTRKTGYLQSAKEIWDFVKSGEDDQLGGGIYWCEQKKESKNTCSNAPASVFALKLFEATKEKQYLTEGRRLYEWTKEHLQDPADKLYWDNIHLNGKVDRTKFSYNAGQMLQAAALLYKLSGEKKYLQEAQELAEACLVYFFEKTEDQDYPRLKNSNLWFHAVMLRGYIELAKLDGNRMYIDIFTKNLDFAWENMRGEEGLFTADWTLKERNKSKWLLDQCAFVEMYARLAKLGR
ncbi:AGE family epimerase/isomerase [Sphingobacterium sp. N143]|uniref:glycoside hydrolase family 76 protein n=1 Tax=Sphingobacterium sp. N143 TaxID=2746727 RepID=UPI0025783908|nr:glycoside hydrolase family 76 protein [Sphingobacterium sp. N143]MDM1293667.1 AGE family epimerase/isomerase [Sphingobacterium sp. N143]